MYAVHIALPYVVSGILGFIAAIGMGIIVRLERQKAKTGVTPEIKV
jgi:hypothetical protein